MDATDILLVVASTVFGLLVYGAVYGAWKFLHADNVIESETVYPVTVYQKGTSSTNFIPTVNSTHLDSPSAPSLIGDKAILTDPGGVT